MALNALSIAIFCWSAVRPTSPYCIAIHVNIHNTYSKCYLVTAWVILLPRPRRGRARYCNAHVCLSVCLCVCPCFRKISKCNISAISQPIIMKLGIHITYGYTVTDKYFQNFRSKVKVVGRRKVKNVIWPYLGNEWS